MATILLYTGADNTRSEILETMVEQAVPMDMVRTFASIDDYTEALRQPCFDKVVLVAAAGTREELDRLRRLSPFMGGHPLVLILPDRDESTIFSGHLLLPRFIDFIDGDFLGVGAVLSKMIPSLIGSAPNWMFVPPITWMASTISYEYFCNRS